MPISDDQKWHWGKGTKYAIEGAKSILLINGAVAVSVLTFIGNTKTNVKLVTCSMVEFAVSALFSAIIFLFCYLAQLHYGNYGAGNDLSNSAHRWHHIAYMFVVLAVSFFVLGIGLSCRGFLPLP